eukprot:1012532-Rhodomonas_salina.4
MNVKGEISKHAVGEGGMCTSPAVTRLRTDSGASQPGSRQPVISFQFAVLFLVLREEHSAREGREGE